MRALLITSSRMLERATRKNLTALASGELLLCQVGSLRDAVDRLATTPCEFVLLDLDLPGQQAEEALPLLCGVLGVAPPPVLTVSDRSDDERAPAALRRGAQDHLIARDDPNTWSSAIRRAMDRHRFRLELHATSERRLGVERGDALTGLGSRQQIEERIDTALRGAGSRPQLVAVLVIDLDRFRTINDSLGHRVGDLVLREVANRIRPLLCAGDFAARIGADQFAVLVTGGVEVADAIRVADNLRCEIGKPYRVQHRELFLTASLGIALHPEHGTNAVTLLRNADAAVIHANAFGGDNHAVYAHRMNAGALDLISLESDLRKAIDRDELSLHFQPLVDGRDGRITGAEALARWHHPRLGMVPPGEFIPLAEDTGLIGAIGHWVMRTACAEIRDWKLSDGRALPVSVNVSPRQFWSGDFRGRVEQALGEAQIPGRRLDLEITESCLLRDVETTVSTLRAVKELGVRISIDDFGTGYSSFNALRRLPLDILKIDQTFLREIPGDENAATIAAAIISLAMSLGLEIIAEGVETPGQREFLLEHFCPLMQGFYFSAPLPAAEFASLLVSGRTLIGAQKRPNGD